MSDIQEQNIDQLLENVGSKKLEWEAFFEIKVTKKNVVLYAIVLLLSIFLAYLFAFDINTKEKFIMVVEKFIEVETAFIAVVFGAYALFQAMVSDEFLELMSKTENNMLKISNKSFLNLILLYLYAIIVNLFLWFILNVIEDNYLLLSNIMWDNIICLIGIGIYFSYSIIILCELKNFAINLYKMFNTYNAYKVILTREKGDDLDI